MVLIVQIGYICLRCIATYDELWAIGLQSHTLIEHRKNGALYGSGPSISQYIVGEQGGKMFINAAGNALMLQSANICKFSSTAMSQIFQRVNHHHCSFSQRGKTYVLIGFVQNILHIRILRTNSQMPRAMTCIHTEIYGQIAFRSCCIGYRRIGLLIT